MKLRTVLCLILTTLLLCPSAAALNAADLTQDTQMEALLEEFREEWGLNADNFSMAYVNLETGEGVVWQYDQWMVAGSTYKVPLAMLYYDKINAGEMTTDTVVGGLQLDSALERIIVNSDNDAAKTLMYAIGNNVWSSYRSLLTQYSDQEYDSRFYSENVMNCHYMVDCLTYLYENADSYSVLLEDMAEAMPGQYFQKYVTDYTVCHKYGLYEGAVNDVAIVYGPQTYILAAFSQDVSSAETMLGELNQLICTTLEETVAEEEAARAAEEAAAEEAAARAAEEAAAEEAAAEEAAAQAAAEEAAAAAAEEEAAWAAAEAAAAEAAVVSIETEETTGEETAAESAQGAATSVSVRAEGQTATWSSAVLFALVFAGIAAVLAALVWLFWWLLHRRRQRRKNRRRR